MKCRKSLLCLALLSCLILSRCSGEQDDEAIIIENITFSANIVTVQDNGDNYICSYEITIQEIHGEYVTLLSANRNVFNNDKVAILETSYTDVTTLIGDDNLEPLTQRIISESTEIGKDIFTDQSSIQWIIAGVDSDLNAIIFSGTILCQL